MKDDEKWMPIDTAPKDRWILLGYTQQGDEMPLGLMVGVGRVYPSGKVWTMNSHDNEKGGLYT